jgi:CBS domain-containing protein
MKRREPISNVMSSNVRCANIDDKLSRVRNILLAATFHHVPIVKGRKLVGIISTRDLLKLNYDVNGAPGDDLDETIDKNFSVEQVMQRDLVTIDSDDTVLTAIDLLAKGKFHSLPVIDEAGDLVGIVTSIDVLAYLMS